MLVRPSPLGRTTAAVRRGHKRDHRKRVRKCRPLGYHLEWPVSRSNTGVGKLVGGMNGGYLKHLDDCYLVEEQLLAQTDSSVVSAGDVRPKPFAVVVRLLGCHPSGISTLVSRECVFNTDSIGRIRETGMSASGPNCSCPMTSASMHSVTLTSDRERIEKHLAGRPYSGTDSRLIRWMTEGTNAVSQGNALRDSSS